MKEDHNKWNYVYYLIYLDRKPANDRTALEKQIAEDNPVSCNINFISLQILMA